MLLLPASLFTSYRDGGWGLPLGRPLRPCPFPRPTSLTRRTTSHTHSLSGLGGGGKQDPKTADNANVALYSTFAVFGFFGGTVCNYIGPRYTLAIGAVSTTSPDSP